MRAAEWRILGGSEGMSDTRPHTGPTSDGSVLGSYRIVGELSSGSMGAVFQAEHVLLGRPAAIKLLRSDLTCDPDLVQRFVNEAKAVTACKHPGIVDLYDFGYTPDGHAYFVMELLEGESLGGRLARGRLGEPAAVAIAHGIASALKAAHRVGVIHRDLKPDNVFLVPDPDGGFDRTKVLDFGIAKLGDASMSPARRTRSGILMGTPLYMAPEQARAAALIDPRADLYSLGCIIYHMLAGRPPFVADGAGEIIALQMFGEVVPPSQLAPVAPELERLVLRLLEKDPADRFASAAELVSALDAVAANRQTSPSGRAVVHATSGAAASAGLAGTSGVTGGAALPADGEARPQLAGKSQPAIASGTRSATLEPVAGQSHPAHAPRTRSAMPEPVVAGQSPPAHPPRTRSATPEPVVAGQSHPAHAPRTRSATPEPVVAGQSHPAHAPRTRSATPEPMVAGQSHPAHPPRTRSATPEPMVAGQSHPAHAPRTRSATPIVAGVAAVVVGAVLAYTLLRSETSVPAILDPAPAPALVVRPPAASSAPAAHAATTERAAPLTPSTAAVVAAPGSSATIEPTEPTDRRDLPGRPDRSDHRIRHATPAPASTRHAVSGGNARTGSASKSGDLDVPDKAIEVIRDIRQDDPPSPGAHTSKGSPIETSVEIGPKRPHTPSDRPKDPTSP
jgi:serine/threonine protein kinase